MSGNFGWRGESRDRDDSGSSAFSDAHRAYTPGTSYTRSMPVDDGGTVGPAPFSRASIPDPMPSSPAPAYTPVDLSPRIHTVTAWNLLEVAIDTTGSVGSWRPEIFKRLALLYIGSEELFGGERRKGTTNLVGTPDPKTKAAPPVTSIDGRKVLELQFVGFGDASVKGRGGYGRADTIEVAPPGSGPELDNYLDQMRKDCDGGGNDCESSDMALLYADRMIKLPAGIRQKILVVVTDEPYPEMIDPEHAQRWLGITLQKEMPLSNVVQSLCARGWSLWCVQKPYGSWGGDATTEETREKWQKLLGVEHVVPLDDARRVVDAILGIVAIQAGKFAAFVDDLKSRHITPDNPYGEINVKTVLTALSSASSVLGAHGRPMRAPQTKALLPAHPETKAKRGDPLVIDAEIVEEE